MQPSERNQQLNEARYDGLSIPGYVIKKESYPWSQTWTIFATVHVLQSTRNAEESPQARLQTYSGQVVLRWQVPQIFL